MLSNTNSSIRAASSCCGRSFLLADASESIYWQMTWLPKTDRPESKTRVGTWLDHILGSFMRRGDISTGCTYLASRIPFVMLRRGQHCSRDCRHTVAVSRAVNITRTSCASPPRLIWNLSSRPVSRRASMTFLTSTSFQSSVISLGCSHTRRTWGIWRPVQDGHVEDSYVEIWVSPSALT